MCRILTCYYRPKPGGFCKRLFRAINALLERGHTVHYLAVVPFPINHPNCHFHRFPWPQAKTQGLLFWGFFHLLAPLQLFFLGIRYRINRLFAFGNNYALFLQPLRMLKRIPLVLFLRADIIENHRLNNRPGWLLAVENILEGFALNGVSLYGVSDTLTRKVFGRHSFFQPSQTGTLRNDIKLSTNTVKVKKKVTLPLRLGCVGILEPRKNQRLLLEVMRGIKEDQAQLYLYGVGPDEQFLKEIVEKKNMTDRIHFMGWVEADRIWPNIDLLLMPSLHEGAPNAVLEALANYVPVLASDIPEHQEILPEIELLTLGNVLEWRNRLLLILDNFYHELSQLRALQAGSTRGFIFDWEGTITNFICKNV